MESASPLHAAWLRYATALGFYLIIAPLIWWLQPRAERRIVGTIWVRPNRMVIAMGLLTFAVSPFLQMKGLHSSRATDGAVMIALEPLITALLAWLILREHLSTYLWVALGLATAGFLLLTDFSWSSPLTGHFVGNLIILTSLVGEAAFSILGSVMGKSGSSQRQIPTALFGTALFVGVVILTAPTLAFEGIPSFSSLSTRSLFGLLWLGPVGTTLSYSYWLWALARSPVSSMALTLFVQPVAGALWGILLLGESVNLAQMAGGVLILCSLGLYTLAGRPTK